MLNPALPENTINAQRYDFVTTLQSMRGNFKETFLVNKISSQYYGFNEEIILSSVHEKEREVVFYESMQWFWIFNVIFAVRRLSAWVSLRRRCLSYCDADVDRSGSSGQLGMSGTTRSAQTFWDGIKAAGFIWNVRAEYTHAAVFLQSLSVVVWNSHSAALARYCVPILHLVEVKWKKNGRLLHRLRLRRRRRPIQYVAKTRFRKSANYF